MILYTEVKVNSSAGLQKERQTNILIIFKFVTLALHKLEGTFIWNFIIEFTFNILCKLKVTIL